MRCLDLRSQDANMVGGKKAVRVCPRQRLAIVSQISNHGVADLLSLPSPLICSVTPCNTLIRPISYKTLDGLLLGVGGVLQAGERAIPQPVPFNGIQYARKKP
jgi:hypothetical protein